MDRRKALKNIGLGAGFLVATPTVLSILQSCKNEPVFIPNFLAKEEGHALRRIVDLIIPSDDTVPGAVDVGVHEFIDNFWNEVIPEEAQAQVRMGFSALGDRFQNMFGKPLGEGKPEEFDQILSKYLKTTKEQEKAYEEKLGQFYQAYQRDKTTIPDADAASFSLLGQLRGMTIWGWKASEEIGENVLAYEPIPGQQVGCLPVDEATGGMAYSL